MRLTFWFIFIILIFSFYSCQNGVKTKKEKDDNVIEWYYLDTLLLDTAITMSYDKGPLYNYSNLKCENCRLYLKDPSKLDTVNLKLTYILENDSVDYVLKIKTWKNEKYQLRSMENENKYPLYRRIKLGLVRRLFGESKINELFYNNILLTQNDTTFFTEKGKLYYSIGNMQHKFFCCDFVLEDRMYNQMLYKKGDYAFIRTGDNIYYSRDLRKWSLIYKGKRAIYESMVVVQSDTLSYMLFTEYTPGKRRDRHHVIRFDMFTSQLDTLHTFYTKKEYEENKDNKPFARHIHVLSKDPYSNNIFLGTGDSDDESAIYYSKDGGITFSKLGGGSQKWRTLSFIYTENDIFWNTDTHKNQYLIKVRRKDLDNPYFCEDSLYTYPLINGALWCTIPITLPNEKKIILMSSNSEGAHFDNKNRIYGIEIVNGNPIVYDLYSSYSISPFSQMFPVGIDNENSLYFCNTNDRTIEKFKLYVDEKK